MSLATVLCTELGSSIEKKNPDYLVDLMKQHVDIVWEGDFKKNPELYKNKIVAVIVWYGMPKVSLACIIISLIANEFQNKNSKSRFLKFFLTKDLKVFCKENMLISAFQVTETECGKGHVDTESDLSNYSSSLYPKQPQA